MLVRFLARNAYTIASAPCGGIVVVHADVNIVGSLTEQTSRGSSAVIDVVDVTIRWICTGEEVKLISETSLGVVIHAGILG